VFVGDLRDPSAAEQAAKGVRAIYHIAPNVNPDEVSIGRNAIAAAQSRGLEHFVFHSVFHPQVEAMPHHWLKARVEELLFRSGLPYTILQPTMYMQNMLGSWDQILGGRYPVPYASETRLSLVDLDDVAQGAAIVLTQSGHADETIEMVGTPAMTQVQIAEALSEQLGHPVVAESVPLERWEQRSRASGMGEYQISTLLKMFSYYEAYGFTGSPNALRALLQREPTSLRDFLQRTISERKDAVRAG
jgi:NAD(P)H dehydrogenase (quinone)